MVANYPFATIDPNVGVVPVPDRRLEKLAEVTKTEEKMEFLPPIVPATVRFVDIAGLVKGAAEGAGLGNKFLSHIREVDLICEVVRAFPDGEIIREGSVEPRGDVETINTELILADMQTLAKAESGKRLADSKLAQIKESATKKLLAGLDKGELASEVELSDEERDAARELQLLTAKKFIYVFNVNTISEWEGAQKAVEELKVTGSRVVVIDAKLEAELAILSPDEQEEYLESLGVKDSGVNALIRESYSALNLISFLTTGVKETRAWPIPLGMKAPQAAGTIHTDFEKAFIKAEAVNFESFVAAGGWKKCREAGSVRDRKSVV